MSKEFLDRLARGQLTNTQDYRKMKEALSEAEQEDKSLPNDNKSDAQEWQNWELLPAGCWSESKGQDKKKDQPIRADSVHRALGKL